MKEDPGEPSENSVPNDFSAHDAVVEWIQDIAPYGIFTTDSAFKIRSWNQWLAAHSGRSPESLIGKSLPAEFPDLERRGIHQRYQNALGGEISVLSAALHKFLLPFSLSGTKSHHALMLQTVRIAPLKVNRRIVGTITIIEDVTERENHAWVLQRQQQHDQMLSRALSVLLLSLDPMRDIDALFPFFTPTLGIDAFFTHLVVVHEKVLRLSGSAGIPPRLTDELRTVSIDEGPCGPCAVTQKPVIIPDLQAQDQPIYRGLRRSGLRFFACFPVAIGTQLFGTFSVGNYKDGVLSEEEIKFMYRLVQYLAIAMERVRREEQLLEIGKKLEEHAGSLELKVHERTARLHETIAELESFSYTVAHDLRAPIRALQGYSLALRDDFGKLLPPEANFMVARMLSASARLDALTRDVLRFSKTGRTEMQLELVNVAEIVDELSSYTPQLRDTLTVHHPLGNVWAQRTLLQQCLANLFENALKFASPQRELRVDIHSEPSHTAAGSERTTPPPFNPATIGPAKHGPHAEAPRGPWLQIWIKDNGIGIPDHARSKIFGIFERSTGSENIEGTGIGLAIVARAMHQMGGSCGVESQIGEGSQFWLALPGSLTDSA